MALLFLVILSHATSRDSGYVTSPAFHTFVTKGCWRGPSGTGFRLVAIYDLLSIFGRVRPCSVDSDCKRAILIIAAVGGLMDHPCHLVLPETVTVSSENSFNIM